MANALKSHNPSGFGLLHSSVIVMSSGNPCGQFEADALTARQKKQPKQQSKSEQTFSEPVHEDIGQFAPDPDWLKVGDD